MTRDEATKLIAHYKLVVTGDSFHKLEALIDFAQAVAAAERERVIKAVSAAIRARGEV
jgi:hypothetical protein